MGVIRKYNPETGKWEVYGSTEAKDINLIDVGNNFENKNVEGALREISDKLNETLANLDAQRDVIQQHSSTLTEHASDIEWLKENGGGGGGTGSSAPTITSTFEDCTVDKDNEVEIPIFFASPNLGEGTAYIIINNIEVGSITGIKQGNNTINIGKLTELNNTVSIYVKDRVNMLSNQLNWVIKAGGIELTIDFDDTADYYVSDMIVMQYYINTSSEEQLKMFITIDYDSYEIDCKNGFNEYTFPSLGVGIHTVSMYISDGIYSTKVNNFNIVVVNSNTLYVSSTFQGGEYEVGTPVSIQYRISKASNEAFNVKLYLNDELYKTLSCVPGAYYWTLNDLGIGEYNARIEVSGTYDDTQIVELSFNVISSNYNPVRVTEDGLIYRLCAKGRTNQDTDREYPIDDAESGVTTKLHGFNYFSNGWIDGELVCDGEAYVEIDMYPYQDNALYGSTIEITYTALDIGFDDARILDYTDIETPYKGIYVDIEEAGMKSMNNTGIVTGDNDTQITMSFVIDRKNKFAKIFIDGICSRAFTLSDVGSGTSAVREDFTHTQKIYLNSKKGLSNFGACKIKDLRVYNRVLSDDEIVSNYIAQIDDLSEQEKVYNFNFNNTTLPVIRMYGDTTNMTLETPVTMRIKYSSPDEDKFGQSFDLPYCSVNWQGTSSLQYVLKNFTARLKDENMAVYDYTPYINGVKEDVYCFKCDYMESTHCRNVGIAKFVNDCLYDTKNPAQLENANIRNSINGFPCVMYINDELQGIYNFNLDRYSTKSFGYTDPDKVLVYEISANSDTTAGAFFPWTEESGKDELAYYKSDFECLYPPTRAAGNDNMSELMRLIEWVDKSSDEDFKDNIGNYFNLEYLLRYYLNVLVFGLVDSLGKNAKLTSFDSGLTWFFQFYDADTSCGLNNSGFLLFGSDIEMGDENVFNTTGSRLWQRIVYLFQDELKAQYALMRQDRFTVENIMNYLYEEQIAKIPATYYNKDMQAKYLNFGSSYLYALHGSSEHQIRKWITERIMYVDTLLGYMVTSADYITIRANKLGEVYFDIEMYQPMYVSVKFRDEADNSGMVTKRVGKGEKVRFSYTLPTATDQEILVYCGKNIKSLGNLSNMEPSTMLIANASRLTEIEVHSPNLINTDLSECKLLQRIDISDCTALGTGVGAQPILNIQNAKYLRYLDCRNTQLTSIYTMKSGSNLEEIYYPQSIQSIQLMNQAYLKVIGIPYELDENGNVVAYCENLADIEINNCKNVEYTHYPYNEGDYVNLDSIKQVQNLTLITSLDKLEGLTFEGFNKLKNLTLSSMHNIKSLGFDNMLSLTDYATLENVTVSDCPLINTVSFNLTDTNHKIEFMEGAVMDLGGVQSIKTIESNASIKGLNTLIIPTSTKELKFSDGFDGGVNYVKNIWSATSNHSSDGFEGIDLLDISLTYLDMNKLVNIVDGVNFHITPISQHPNMNTYRTDNFFRPEGSIDLTYYTGDMVNMLKGIDLSKMDIIINETRPQIDLTGLFENSIISYDNIGTVNDVLDKYNVSTIWSGLFKNAEIEFEPTDINIPGEESYRMMDVSEMFYNTSVSEDIIMTSNLIDVTRMFNKCKNMTSYNENWNNILYTDIITTDCYAETRGDLELVPAPWGGYGFFDDVTSIITVNIPSNDYTIKLGNKYKITTEYGIVNWGDGNINNILENDYSHTYVNAGVYTIKGHFTFGKGYVNNTTLSNSLTEVKQLARNSTDLSNAFKYCSKLTSVNLGSLELNNMKDMFSECVKLTDLDISLIDTSKVNNMSGTFYNCSELSKLDLNHFITQNVTDMSDMFNGCEKLSELIIDIFDTQNVKDMSGLFCYCRALTTLDLSNFDTGNVINMSNMFRYVYNVTDLDLSNFDTSKVTDMQYMFSNCNKLETLNIANFDTSNVTNMNSMFYGCNNIPSLDLSNFDTSKVTDMTQLFYNCNKLQTLNVSNFNTTNVTTMYRLFCECKRLTSVDISSFDTSNVTDMSYMFSNCGSLNKIDVSKFDTSKVINMSYMFDGCTNIVSLDLVNFNTSNVTNMMSMFNNCLNASVIDVSNFDTSSVSNISNLFYNCKKVTELDVGNFNIGNASNLSSLFYNCNNIESLAIDNWDTSNVTNMAYLFYSCNKLSDININAWDVDRVTNMVYLFYNCNSIEKIDLSNWTTTACTNMNNMFYNCNNLSELKLDSFDTSKVTNMAYMFYNCALLNDIDLSHFNTSNVTSMRNMFYGCSSITSLDLSAFDTSKVTNMAYMLCNVYCDVVFTDKINPELDTTNAMFNIYYGESIDMSNFSLENSSNNDYFISMAPNLVSFIPPTNINSSIKLSADQLSYESLLQIIANLMDVDKAMTLEIGSNNLGKLNDDDILIAIDKGWTIC